MLSTQIVEQLPLRGRARAGEEERDLGARTLAAAAHEDVGLHGRAERHNFVWIEFTVRGFHEQFLNTLPNKRSESDSTRDRWLITSIGK